MRRLHGDDEDVHTDSVGDMFCTGDSSGGAVVLYWQYSGDGRGGVGFSCSLGIGRRVIAVVRVDNDQATLRTYPTQGPSCWYTGPIAS